MAYHCPGSFTEAEGASSSPASTLPSFSLLDQAEREITNLGPDFSTDVSVLENLSQRLAEERFHLAVLGQFKRGKSTLLNALLGEELLPTSVVPVTAIPTFLLPGSELRARVYYLDERPPGEYASQQAEEIVAFLTGFVSEEANPGNRLGVSFVEVTHPSPLLHGVVLIDTPGIGSTFRHNTETTLNFLPQCDAALFLLSADPPITEAEVDFLKEVRLRVPNLFFVLNKVDYLTGEDADKVLRFLKEVLREEAKIEVGGSFFPVSARQGLEARRTGDPALWTRSGMEEVENRLVHFLAKEKAAALQQAISLKASDIIIDVQMRIQMMVHSLRMPMAQLEQRLGLFDQKLQEAEQQRTVAGDLLEGDRKRLESLLEDQAEGLRKKSRAFLEGIVQRHLVQSRDLHSLELKVQEEMANAIPAFFEHELGEVSRNFSLRVSEVFKSHQQRAGELIETMRKTASELFEVPYHSQDHALALETSRKPYWVQRQWDSTAAPIPPGALDGLLPSRLQQRRLHKRLLQQIESLVRHNVENLRWATLQNLDRSFRRFSADLEERLQETVVSIRKTIQRARSKREQQADSLEAEILKLEGEVARLEEILCQFAAEERR
jgi:GTP-binding protein EngB required for normal cell division